ncbi:serine/threonine-protein kinase [Leptolyngbya boryana CZ1]|uniref:non-specific serine/threonine protein kinase n=1 Tax=Leptolyngbya boryana CZ1 TaxID=3060204 RepID=A0AA96WT25_LEPBY|nr:serine/threonine-protein kinase [Leptolyngbya boryana]WNZ45526.1 serine/threonine-protein kinase [Leptolyngbya boryana CZ1]
MQPPIPPATVLQSRYRILSVLGQGGFGRTYLAEDQGRFNEACAIKELTPPQDNPYALEKSKELFQREAQTLYQIQHPQIPQFRATFEQDQRFFIVQDYVEGPTYRSLLDERKSRGYVFSEAEVTQLVKQVLPVLAYIHGKGIIHRDIAPDNIILRDHDKLPVLIDFGVVKDLATRIQAQDTVKQHTTVGKLGYAPTEQMQTGRAYPNSDLYALAVTAVVLLTGREPQDLFDENTMTWRWQRFVNLEPTFGQVLNRMLSYRVSDRYQSATEVLQVLQSPATMAPLPATPPPTQAQPPTNVSRAETLAVGRRDSTTVAPTSLQNRNDPSIPSRSSLWDDPWAVLAIGTGLVLLTGLGAWTITRALMTPAPIASPTPTATTPSPSPTKTATPKPSPTTTPSPDPVTYSQRLDFVQGAATRSGTLKSNETLNFIVPANQGQQLNASLGGGEGVLLSVLAPNRDPVDSASNRVSNWAGELPFTGDYIIQLRTVKGIPKSDFKLNVNLQTPAPSPSPSPSPTASPSIVEAVIEIPQGQTGTKVSERVDALTTRRYLINVRAKQSLALTLTPGTRFTVRYPDGSPVEDATNLQRWSAIVPKGGSYQVDVTSDAPAEFTLTVDVQG